MTPSGWLSGLVLNSPERHPRHCWCTLLMQRLQSCKTRLVAGDTEVLEMELEKVTAIPKSRSPKWGPGDRRGQGGVVGQPKWWWPSMYVHWYGYFLEHLYEHLVEDLFEHLHEYLYMEIDMNIYTKIQMNITMMVIWTFIWTLNTHMNNFQNL